MAVTPEQLKQVPLFSELNGNELKSIAGTLRERTFDAGTKITEGATASVSS